jgi:MYXO-CTERM domain-containing protein
MVSDACSTGSIIHEIGHALGLFHEHTRSDRDNYVQIDWNEIVDGKDINFHLQVAGAQNLGPYDYGSIMHYGEYFFSASANKPTIIVPDGIEIGQRIALSDIDAESIDQLYATDLALLAPGVSTNDNGLELDVTVLNQGNLGAHQLELIVKLTDDANWQGISRDSGWQCLTYASELRCSRPTLTEQSESRFSLLVNPGSGSADDIRMLLRSRTLDLNPANNAINDDGLLGRISTAGGPGDTAADAPDQTNPEADSEPVQLIPAVGAAQAGTATVNDASAAGSHNGSLGLMLLGLLGWRRLRTHRRRQ